MIDVPLSIVAWCLVVAIQAVIHYVVLGSRRERQIQKDEDLIIEESLSLATNEGSIDAAGDERVNILTHQDSFTLPDIGVPENASVLLDDQKLLDGDEPQDFLQLLTQTGSELVQVRKLIAH
jgi:hypothetical protein